MVAPQLREDESVDDGVEEAKEIDNEAASGGGSIVHEDDPWARQESAAEPVKGIDSVEAHSDRVLDEDLDVCDQEMREFKRMMSKQAIYPDSSSKG